MRPARCSARCRTPAGRELSRPPSAITDNGSGVTRQVTTDSRGEFRSPDLLPGNYHVVVSAKGFAEASADVTVQVSNVRDVLVTLRPAR